jgi:hypothetical protein
MTVEQKVAERHHVTRQVFEAEILPAGQPVVMRGLVAGWPAVAAAMRSATDLAAYLRGMDRGAEVETFVGPPSMRGRYFYNADLTGFNFEKGKTTLSAIADKLLSMDPVAPALMIYAGSAPAGDAVPRFADDNPMPLLDAVVGPRLWLGNRSRVAAHYDNSRNIACCISGTRRFTLFPPDQIGSLYLGPLEFTMAGPPASMVDFDAPDFARFPRFTEAQRAAFVAELAPGDALYLPSLWFHHVAADGPFNLLANYWWMPENAGSTFEALMLAMIDLRDQPIPEKEAWRAFFEHFVFARDAHLVADHLPPALGTAAGPKSMKRDAMVLGFIKDRLARRQR